MLAVVASQDISNLATPPTNEESKWAGSKAPVDINLQQAGMTGASTACHWPPRGCPQALCLVGSRGLTELARTLPSLNFGSNKLIWAGLVPMERYDRSHKEQGSASVQCQDRKPGTVRGTRVLICYPSNGLARGILGCPRYPTQPYMIRWLSEERRNSSALATELNLFALTSRNHASSILVVSYRISA